MKTLFHPKLKVFWGLNIDYKDFVEKSIVYAAFLLFSFLAFSMMINISYGIDSIALMRVFSNDEPFAIALVKGNLRNSNLNPNSFYIYGYLYHTVVYYFSRVYEVFFSYSIDERFLALGFRYVSLFSYVISCFLVYRILVLLRQPKPLAACAMLFFSALPSLYYWGQRVHPDTFQLLFILLSAYSCFSVKNHALNIVLTPTLAGIGFGIKYGSIYIFPFLVLSVILSVYPYKSDLFAYLKEYSIKILAISSLMLSIFLAAYLITNPYVLIHSLELFADLKYQKTYVSVGDKNALLWFVVFYEQFKVLGSIIILFGFSFTIYKFWKQIIFLRFASDSIPNRNVVIMIIYTAISFSYLLFIFNFKPPRYTFHIIPFIVILSYFGISQFLKSAFLQIRPKLVSLLYVFLLFSVLPLFISTIKSQSDVTRKYEHPYIKATQWLEEHFNKWADQTVIADSYSYQSDKFSNWKTVWGVSDDSIKKHAPTFLMINKSLSGRLVLEKRRNNFR